MSGRSLVVHVVGARPNYMKIAPVFTALARHDSVEQRLIHTGQHYDAELKDVFFAELPLPQPDVELEVGSGSHGEQTARALVGVERALLELEPDLVVVPGDVNSTLAAALAAVKLGIPVCHVESGLRSFDPAMPEEHNRRLTDHLSTLLLTHSRSANDNLAAEGIPAERVEFVGNTMIDTLRARIDDARALRACSAYGLDPGSYLLATLHRPALVDDRELLRETVRALRELSSELPVLLPAHPRTAARLSALELDGDPRGRLTIVPPLAYLEFLSLEADAAAVVTDSGGVQEETTALGVPCFTFRAGTERPVTVTDGTNIVLGVDPARLLEIPALRDERRVPRTPELWDGHAGERAATAIEHVLEAADTPAIA
jgi:UDP-N-acetylglucosamine 2-epimerase (non-hydrolysing)